MFTGPLTNITITEVTSVYFPSNWTNVSNIGVTADGSFASNAGGLADCPNVIRVRGYYDLPRDAVPYEIVYTLVARCSSSTLISFCSSTVSFDTYSAIRKTSISASANYNVFSYPYTNSVIDSKILVTAQGTAVFSKNLFSQTPAGTSETINVDNISPVVRYVFAPDLHAKSSNGATSYGGKANAWSNPQNVSALDTSYTSIIVGLSGTNDTLRCKDFGFTTPSAATIRGVAVNAVIRTSGSVDYIGGTVRLLKSGVPVGNTLTHGADNDNVSLTFSIDASSNVVFYDQLWGTTLTPGDINNSNFGVDLTFWAQTTAGVGSTIRINQVTLQVIADTNSSMLYLGETPLGYESPAVQITKIINIGGISPEYGYKNTNPKAYIHTPENLYGWEAGSVTLRKSVITPNPEFSHSITSVDIWQLHYRTPQRADYGYESMSVVAFDPTYDAGWDAKSTSLTQRHYLNPVSSEYSWKLDKYILYYDAVRSPTNSKYGWSSVTNRLYQDHYFGAYDSDYDFEIDSIRVRDFTITPVPLRRTVKVLREARKVIVVQQRRTIVV